MNVLLKRQFILSELSAVASWNQPITPEMTRGGAARWTLALRGRGGKRAFPESVSPRAVIQASDGVRGKQADDRRQYTGMLRARQEPLRFVDSAVGARNCASADSSASRSPGESTPLRVRLSGALTMRL